MSNYQPTKRRLSSGGIMFHHPCRICGSDRAFHGFGVNLKKGVPGRWYCQKHKHLENEG